MRRLVELVLASCVLCMAQSCTSEEPCGVPGVVEACPCGGNQGARVCNADKTWRACDCSGGIALPNAILQASGTGGAGSSGMGGMGGGMTSGTGGRSGTGGTSGMGGSAGVVDDDDSGMPPVGGEGGASGSAGAGTGGAGEGGAGSDAGQVDPNAAYRGCSTAADCDFGAQCTITMGFPTNSNVCAPACVDVGDCPVPDGTYEAVISCTTGLCQLDCTPVLFAPLLSCPTGMACIAPTFGVALCHDDGV